jgi:predicted Zn finger-like uncharacterized protein
MAITCACPGCATPFNVTDDMAGKRGKCPKCLMVFTVPAAAPVPPAGGAGSGRTERTADPESYRDAGRYDPDRKSGKSATRRDDRDERDDHVDDEPRSRRTRARRQSGSSMLPWVLGLGAAALLLFVVCAGVITIVVILAFRQGDNKAPVAVAGGGNNLQPVQGGGQGGQAKPGAIRLQMANGQASVGAQLTFQDPVDPTAPGCRAKLYQIDLQAGRTYQIDMVSPNPNVLDPFLRIEDMNGRELAQDDDSGGNLNARIIFSPPVTGSYIIYATTFRDNTTGPFTLTVRENKGFK